MYHYFSEYCNEISIDFQQLMALGRRNVYDRDERFQSEWYRFYKKMFADKLQGRPAS